MNGAYLEITYRKGSPLAAYYSLVGGSRSAASTRSVGENLVVDFDAEHRAIGIEIIDPRRVTLEAFNALLESLGQSAIDGKEFAPLVSR